MTGNVPDYYALLGVAPSAAPEEIRRAYGERARTAQYDRPFFEAVTEAYETLKDEVKRAAYDAQRGAAQAPPENPENTMSGRTMAMPQGGESTMGGATIVLPSGPTLAGERTTNFAVNLPTVCPAALSPCPLKSGSILPDEGFCPECGYMLGSPLGGAVAARPLPKLVEVATGREFTLRTGANVVGREGADVMLPDRSVSRRHAQVIVETDGAVVVEDTGSTNGTLAAGSPVGAGRRAALADQMPVQFGAVKMTISIPAGEPMRALPLPSGESGKAPLAALAAPKGMETPASLVGKDGKVYPLPMSETTIGRRAGNAIVINGDSTVSGAHAKIICENGSYSLVDMGSTNGTRLNGKKLSPNSPEKLAGGDEIIFGQTPFTFRPSTG